MKNEFPQGVTRSSLDLIECKSAVYDMIMPKEFHIKPMLKPNILICIELSGEMISGGHFEAALQHVQNTLDSIKYEGNIGIVTFNHGLTYYSIPEDLTDENIKRTTCIDFESPFCALSQGELYLSVKDARNKIGFLINHLTTLAQSHDTSKPASTNLDILYESISQSMEHTGGKVLIFGASQPTLGKSATAKLQVTDDGKASKTFYNLKVAYDNQNEYIETIGKSFNENRISVDQFWFHGSDLDIATLAYVSQRTGGKFHYYPEYNSFTHYNQVFYETYSCLTRYTAYEVVARLRCSDSVTLQSFHTPLGLDPQIDINLASMNSEHCLLATFETSQIKTACTYFQLVLIHSDFYGYRKLRVINFVLVLSNNMDTFYQTLNCEALVYCAMRTSADLIKSLEREKIRMQMLSLIAEVVKEYRKYINRPGFEVPNSLEYLVMYTHSLLREPIYNTKLPHPCSIVYGNYLTLIQSNLDSVMNYLYPKIFPVHNLNPYEDQGPGLPPAESEDCLALLPRNEPCSDAFLDSQGVYVVDDGLRMLIVVRSQVSDDVIQNIFGYPTLEEFQEVYHFTHQEDNQYNCMVNNIMEEMSRLTNNYTLSKIVVIEG